MAAERGPLNDNPPGEEFAPAPNLVLAHSHLNNARDEDDGGLEDFSSLHVAGSFFLFADGSVRFLRNVISDKRNAPSKGDSLVLEALGTRAGSEILTTDLRSSSGSAAGGCLALLAGAMISWGEKTGRGAQFRSHRRHRLCVGSAGPTLFPLTCPLSHVNSCLMILSLTCIKFSPRVGVLL